MNDILDTRSGRIAIGSLIAIAFFAFRVPLLYAREPFFDELFTLWIVQKPFGGIVAALQHDSGPPLYYFVVRALGIASVTGARLASLVCASVAVAMISLVGARHARLAAAALLAVFPPAVLFAVDARAYAMCAMFVAIAIVCIEHDHAYAAAVALALAAYSHYYGALFFPILLFPLVERGRPARWPGRVSRPEHSGGTHHQPVRPRAKRVVPFIIAIALFAPGIWLAFHQPVEAMAWLARRTGWPDALWPRPQPVVLIAAVLVAIAAAIHWNRFTAIAAIPVAGALVLAAASRAVYFPLRFESVIAVPLVLAIAVSLEQWQRPVRLALMTSLFALFAALSYLGIVDHARRPPDDYRVAAQWVAAHVPAGVPVIATGYLYLETVMNGRADAFAFPAEQAIHPGWRAFSRTRSVVRPPGEFVWIGERGTPELRAIASGRHIQPLFVNRRAMVARVR